MVPPTHGCGPLDPQAATVLAEIAALAEPDMTTVEPDVARRIRARRPLLRQTPIHAVDTVDIAGVPCLVYRSRRDPAPTLLWFHGGGWVLGGQATHDEIYRALAAKTGCHVVAPEYALAPERPFPAAVDECIAVVEALTAAWVPDGLTVGPLAIGGDSAGANLAIVAALSSPHPSHRALAVAYPVTDARCSSASYDLDHSESYLQPHWMRWFVEHYLSAGGDASDWRISPALAPDANLRRLPPTYILVASHDPLRDEGLELAGRLVALGHDTELVRADGLPHGFLGFASRVAAGQRQLDNLCAFVRQWLII
ncbi:hypothetical protein BH24ACT5_BH24ACT5_05990 [soil metagenome]